MSSCDIEIQNAVQSVLNKPEHQKTISKINDLVNQIPCDRQNGGGMTKAQYVQLVSLVTAILVAVNAVMEVNKIQSGQCDIQNMIMNALTQSQFCTTQSNTLSSAITTAVVKVTGAASLGVTGYLLDEKKKEIEDNKEPKGGRRVRKARKSRKTKKSRKVKKSKKAKKVKKTRKARKAKKSRKA
jgi:hypothetical protein